MPMRRLRSRKLPRESAPAIRSKNRFWRAPMRREAGEHENFFIAKIRDSESAQSAFSGVRRLAMTSIARRRRNARIAKTPAVRAYLAILTIVGAAFSRTIRIAARMPCGVVDQPARSAPGSLRQHFLKQDAVFLGALVYSG
jgi:hypothetical protein